MKEIIAIFLCAFVLFTILKYNTNKFNTCCYYIDNAQLLHTINHHGFYTISMAAVVFGSLQFFPFQPGRQHSPEAGQMQPAD